MSESIKLCVLLICVGYIHILRQETKAYARALSQVDAGFAEFMQKSSHGKKLYEYVNPHSVGIFKIQGVSIACANLNTPLPGLPKNKD